MLLSWVLFVSNRSLMIDWRLKLRTVCMLQYRAAMLQRARSYIILHASLHSTCQVVAMATVYNTKNLLVC